MTSYAYRIVNVFTRGVGRLTGNPLCVFEDARGLDDATLQALARQFNLSETTFILPSEKAASSIRAPSCRSRAIRRSARRTSCDR